MKQHGHFLVKKVVCGELVNFQIRFIKIIYKKGTLLTHFLKKIEFLLKKYKKHQQFNMFNIEFEIMNNALCHEICIAFLMFFNIN